MAKFGFVIFREALCRSDCRASREELWSYLEQVPGFRRSQPSSYEALSQTPTGRYYDAYGLPPEPVVFSKEMLRNRQNGEPGVVDGFTVR